MTQQIIRRGNAPNDHANADSQYETFGKIADNETELFALQSQTVNAGAVAFSGPPTVEQRIALADAYAFANGFARLYIPAYMLVGGYDITLCPPSAGVQRVREGGDFSVYDAWAYGAIGNGVADDRPSILTAEAARAAHGGILYFPKPSVYYTCSDYIDATAGLMWVGQGGGAGPLTESTYILATGTNKGVLRWRVGTPGSPDPLLRGLYLSNLGFSGGATTGHLLDLARVSIIRADKCWFNNSGGTGFKDDGTTVTAAAGVHAYGCEHLSFNECGFESNNRVADGGGAGIYAEQNVHMVAISNGQFNGNTHNIRLGTDNGVWHVHGGTNFQGGEDVLQGDAGGNYDITLDTCWAENQTSTAGAILHLSGSGSDNLNIVVRDCFLHTTTVNTLKCFQGTMSHSRFENNRLSGQWSQAFAVGSTFGGNVESGTYAPNILQWWAGDSPAAAGMIRTSVSDAGGISADRGNASQTINWGFDAPVQLWNTVLTADRTCSMRIWAGSPSGEHVRVIRGAGATGAFNLTVQDSSAGLIKVLATAGTWVDVLWNGTLWVETASGSL